MGFGGLKKLFQKRYRIFLIIFLWLLIGIIVAAFRLGLGLFILTPLIPLCIILCAVSFFIDLRDMHLLMFIIVIIITVFLVFFFFIFSNVIIPLLFEISIISYIIITAIFTLYAVYEGSRNLDEIIYTRFPSPTHHIMRWIEFAGGIARYFNYMGDIHSNRCSIISYNMDCYHNNFSISWNIHNININGAI